MKGVEAWRVNAFTAVPFAGNPAGVVPEAGGLSDDQMQAVARELNDISETVFVCPPDAPGADCRLRYFTSCCEVDLCGHATVAALFTLAWSGRLSARDGARRVRAATRAGLLELELRFERGRPVRAEMEQLEPRVAAAPGAVEAAAVLGLDGGELDPGLPVACAFAGLWACFVPLRSVESLGRVRVDRGRIGALWPDNPELTGVYPFAFLEAAPVPGALTTQGRFFVPPKYGIVEDPVTGTACAALGGYLLAQGRLPPSGELVARQGFEMGRGGEVRVRRGAGGRMRIAGQAAPVFRGRLCLGSARTCGS